MMRCIALAAAMLACCATALAQPPTSGGSGFPSRPDKFTAQSLVEGLEASGITESGDPREHTPIAVAMLKDFEGWEPKPYLDSSEYCTVGYGHLLARKHCNLFDPLPYEQGITEAEGETLLQKDTEIARRGIQANVRVDINDAQFGALTNFVFNIGVDRFSNSTMLSLINEGDFESAAKQFGRWIRSGTDKPPGLVTRRACEAALFRGDVQFNTLGKFDRESCSGNGIADDGGDPIDINVGE